MELASTRTVVLGSFAFLIFWVMATFPKFPGLPIGRTAGAIVGATLMVVFQVNSPDEAYASVNLPILGLLFGTMVVSVFLQRADMFSYLAAALSWRCSNGKDLLCRLSFLIALASAVITNDTFCILFTEFILTLCKEKGLPPEPFLLALATSANLGSSATPIGNPQNLVIAIQSKISFGKFVAGILPAMLVGVTLNLCLLLGMYWNQLSTVGLHDCSLKAMDLSNVKKGTMCPRADVSEDGRDAKSLSLDELEMVSSGSADQFPNPEHTVDIRVNRNHPPPYNSQANHADQNKDMALNVATQMTHTDLDNKAILIGMSTELKPEKEIWPSITSPLSSSLSDPCFGSPRHTSIKRWRKLIWKPSVYLVTIGMLAALLRGLNLSWCTLTAAIVLIVLDFRDAGKTLSKVSYSLLVFFSGMFITVDGFNRTGVPATFWNAVEPHARINHVSGVAVFTGVILLLSNVASNVPTVLLLGPKVAASAAMLPGGSATKAWLILAWVSTIAGNLTLVGSAANLIVCEQARMAPKVSYHLSFWRHLRFGFPATLLTVAIGLPLIRG